MDARTNARRTFARLASILLALAAAQGAAAPAAPAPAPGAAAVAAPAARRPAGLSGTVVVPDRLLRRWDPVTIFFARDAGPAGGGPEDHPERLVRLVPDHPGAFAWIDRRTLQFKPAEPWPSLTRFAWTVEGKTTTLSTLMAAPVEMVPAPGQEGLGPVDAVTLTFADPLDAQALARMATIELRPLPGLGGTPGARTLGADDFEVKALERS